MASSSSSGRGFSLSIDGPSRRIEPPRPTDADVLRFLIIADCSGRSARAVIEPVAGRRAQPVDVERLERVMASWRARVPTTLFDAAGSPFWLEPRSLDDLHPDQLLASAEPLAELERLRASLGLEPAARVRLSELLASAPGSSAPGASARESAASESAASSRGADAPVSENGADLLARLLGDRAAPAQPAAPPTEAQRAAPRAPSGPLDIDRFVRAIVGNAVESSGAGTASAGSTRAPPPNPAELAALAAAAEAELGRRLRALLASPALRALEATWRGIDGLCRHNPDEARIRLYVLDASLDELGAGPGALSELLTAVGPNAVVLDHLALPSPEALRTLAGLLDVCHQHDASLLVGAHPELAGCAHFNEVSQPEENAVLLPDGAREPWAELLAARERGARLGLVLPRFLLRQPYGASGDPLERFAFEEILDPGEHDAFPWGNGAYLLARALGIEHAGERGVHPDGSIDVRELPIVYLEGDPGAGEAAGGIESRIKPSAEAWLSERSLGRLRAAGFSVLLGIRDTDRVRVYP
jgi:predicted component of type VI protein secretion system